MGPEDSYCMLLHCNENPIYVLFFWELHESVPNQPSCVCEWFIYSQDRSIYVSPCSRIGRPTWKYINLSQIYECRNWETEHYNSVLELSRLHSSFLGRHKWEPDIYIGFSQAFICSVVLTYVAACRHPWQWWNYSITGVSIVLPVIFVQQQIQYT